jgi:uncharacterized protein (TIGR03435 family)
MKTRPEKTGEILDRSLALFNHPSPEEIEVSRELALRFLESTSSEGAPPEDLTTDSIRSVHRWRWPLAVAMAAAVAAAVIIPKALPRNAPGTFQTANGVLRVEYGDLVRSPEAAGDVLVLADGSRVEMRSGTELRLERAEDGVRILLNRGSVIVNAARQRGGHLYVQTKDALVSVVGTVFLVNEEGEGSRVAVIEGAVRVRQGATERSLMPGEQVMTEPRMEWQPVSEEIAWSRHVEEHLALLQQSAPVNPVNKPRPVFEVASVKPVDRAVMSRDHEGKRLDPAIFVERTDLLQYIVRAYIETAGAGCILKTMLGQDCPTVAGNLPSWIKTDRWEIQAKLPANAVPRYTDWQLHNYDTPELNQMLQVLLEDRFRLKAHREFKEIPVYVLTVAKDGPKFAKTPPRGELLKIADGSVIEFHGMASLLRVDGRTRMTFQASSMKDAAEALEAYFDRPVLDRTGLKENYDFTLEYQGDPTETGPPAVPNTSGRGGGFFNPFTGLSAAAASAALQEIGLKLESTKASVEVLVVDHVEKPSEN